MNLYTKNAIGKRVSEKDSLEKEKPEHSIPFYDFSFFISFLFWEKVHHENAFNKNVSPYNEQHELNVMCTHHDFFINLIYL